MECHNCETDLSSDATREIYVKRAKLLAVATVAWNLLEGVVAVMAGQTAGSIALVGFGMDSAIETISASIVGFRFWSESRGTAVAKVESLEVNSARFVGLLLLILACYVTFESIRKLAGFDGETRESLSGIILTLAALIVMPILARAKYNSAKTLASNAMRAEAFQSLTCAWVAGSTLLGLMLNALFHWSWADPVAALLFVPAIIREGINALKGELCSDCH